MLRGIPVIQYPRTRVAAARRQGNEDPMELREVTEAAQWDALVADHAYGHPLQCWGWGEVKGRSGWRAHRLAVFEGEAVRAGAQVLTPLVPGMPLPMLYVPRGPVAAPHGTAAPHALAAGARPHPHPRRGLLCAHG